MKAIILAAWEWTRLRPFTNTIPKPMIKIFGKPILEHNIESFYTSVDEIIIVVKYKQEIIRNYFKNDYKGTKITYIEQSDEKWTWAAIRWISLPKTDILLLNGDSIFEQKDFDKIISFPWYGALVKKVEDPSKYWIFKQNENGLALEVIEKPETFVWDLANLWVYKFDEKIIEISKNIPLSKRWEYEITDSINAFIKEKEFQLFPIDGNFIDIGYPWDILQANAHFLENLTKTSVAGEIEEWVTIKWKVILEEWAILKAGTYIEWNVYIGKNTSIWPNAYLRGSTVIWENCHIWASVEIKNSSLWDNTNVAHLSYIWDSILGNNINIGGGMITANLRHDKWDIKVMVKWELINSHRHKLWVIIWDNSKTGIKTMTYPGRIIDSNSFTTPWEIVK